MKTTGKSQLSIFATYKQETLQFFKEAQFLHHLCNN